MDLIRNLSKATGAILGTVIGGPIQIAGEIANVKPLEDIGRRVRKSSTFAGDTVGQACSGAVDTISGILTEDSSKLDKGLGNMANAVSRTAKGVMATAQNALYDGGDVIGGFMERDYHRLKKGASSLGSTVAVGILTVGFIDVIDSADGAQAVTLDPTSSTDVGREGSISIETTNDHLVDFVHPETGVPFESKTVELPYGQDVSGVYPVFDVEHQVLLDESLYLQSDYVHFSYANAELFDALHADPRLAADLGLTQQDIQALANGDTPQGFTWHHNEEPGVLQLVEEEIHANTGHDGGRELWGGGEEYR